MTSGQDRFRIAALDGWRAVSIALVIAFHFAQSVSPSPVDAVVARTGWLGVKIFFVISGFVICRGLIAEQSERGAVSLAAFYIRRCARILPPLALYLAALSSLGAYGPVQSDWNDTGRAILFTCNLQDILGPCHWTVGHTWSLAYEEQFYLLFPLLFVMLPQHLLTSVTMALVPAVTVLLYFAGWGAASRFVGELIPIGFGVALALLWSQLRHLLALAPSLIIIASCALIASLTFAGNQSAVLTGLRLIAVPALIGTMLGASCARPSICARVLSWRPLAWVGRGSYGLYLGQQLVFPPHLMAPAYYYVLGMTSCIAIVALSYAWIETPAIAYGRRLSARLQRSAADDHVPIVPDRQAR